MYDAAVPWSEQEALDETVAVGGPRTVRNDLGATVPDTPLSVAQTAYTVDRPPVAREMAPGDDPLIGSVIDHFEVRGLLGEGGMGRVYLAHDLSLERPVALKVMREELADYPELVDRMIMEARAQARIQHPHVVAIYYVGRYRGAPYFAMEFVNGQTLEDRMKKTGPIPWVEALECIIQTARALFAAHLRGIAHRDVKPSNILMSHGSLYRSSKVEIKVADFGLAAPIGSTEEHFAGTPRYAAPERIDGRKPDHRSDIYSLGVAFYEILTGQPPFDAKSMTDLFAKHMSAPRPPISEELAPWRLRRLVSEMMDADPFRRPATYEELLERLMALRPKPVVAGGVPARATALAIDLGLVAGTSELISGALALGDSAGSLTALGLLATYYLVCHRLWQRTVGKRMLGLRLQGTDRAVTLPRLILRFAVEFWAPIMAVVMIAFQVGAASDMVDLGAATDQIGAIVGVNKIPVLEEATQPLLRRVLLPNVILVVPWIAGFLLALFDDNRQALHDRASHTKVVYAVGEG